MHPGIRIQLIVFLFLRTILNTAHRMVYPFLSVFARGLGVDIASMSLLMTFRSLIGSASPLFGHLADRYGRKFGMASGVVIFIVAVGLVAFHPSFITLAASLLLAVLGKYLFDPSMQAYLGDRIPYTERGTALAITEVSWSMAFIAGVPAMGFLIARYGWSAPFPVFTGLGLLVLITIIAMVPNDKSHLEARQYPKNGFPSILTSPHALAGISIAMWASAGNELVNMVFGIWLEDSFGLKIAALAGASAVIGLSELSGEGLVAFTTDKLGKPLALGIGLAGNAVASMLLPWLGQTQFGALIGLFLFYITFEYVLVSHIPLVSELFPSARATALALNVTGHSAGRALGAFLSGIVYQNFGFMAVTLGVVGFNLLGLFALRIMSQDPELRSRFHDQQLGQEIVE